MNECSRGYRYSQHIPTGIYPPHGQGVRSQFLLHAWCRSGADTVPMHGNNRHNGYFLIKLRVNQGHLITSWREWRLWTYFTPHLHRRGRRFESCSAHLCIPRDGGFFFHVPIYGRLVVRCLVLGYFRVQPCATAVMFLLRFVASRPQQA